MSWNRIAPLSTVLLGLVTLGVLGVLATLGARPALAGDARPVSLPLASGKAVEGVVESADAREVVLRVGPEEVRRIPWEQLRPLGVFRARAALAPAADGEARLRLAEMAAELGLHAEARAEYEKALALGALERKVFEKAVAAAEREAVESGVQQALKAADSGDLEGALETARELKIHFASAPNAAAVDRLIGKILARVQTLDAEAKQAADELERVTLDVERNKEILRRKAEAAGRIEAGRAEAQKAADARERGNVTRARKHAEAANEDYDGARRHLGRLRRILRAGDTARRDVITHLNDLDRLQFDLLFQTAWFFWDQRVYGKAEEFAARASYIDPVHPDLLDLRDQIRSVRIRYRLSDITNARPRIR